MRTSRIQAAVLIICAGRIGLATAGPARPGAVVIASPSTGKASVTFPNATIVQRMSRHGGFDTVGANGDADQAGVSARRFRLTPGTYVFHAWPSGALQHFSVRAER